MDDIIITTTPSIEGHQIKNYLGLVASKGWVPTIAMQGDSKKDKNLEHQYKLMESVESGLKAEAERLNANAVVSVKFHYDKGGVGSTLIVFGTAVLIE